MTSYTARDVERVLSLSRSTLRGLINTGLVSPSRGSRREYRFTFQDLILLRAARTLIEAKIPTRRIRRSLQALRRHLPETMPLSGLSISAVGDRVVVRDGTDRWHVDSGQYLLGLEVSVEGGVLQIVERKNKAERASRKHGAARGAAPGMDADAWFGRGLELERSDCGAALEAYRHATDLDPGDAAAWINRGRLLHETGATHEAEEVYRLGLENCGKEPLLLFNLGVLLEDEGNPTGALAAYQDALAADPALADCHFNIARLYESLHQPQHAIRHLGQYRRLVTGDAH